MGKRHKPEEIIAKLRQVEVMSGQGTTMADAIRSIGVTEVTYYRWRSEYGGMKLDQVKRLKELEVENARLRKAVSDLTLDKLILKEAARETSKPLAPASCVEHIRRELHVSERRACVALGQHRSTQRKAPRGRADEVRLTADIMALARAYGRYGYRRITALLNEAGWDVSVSRVARIWRREGLKVPVKQPKRRRLWLADGSASGCGRSGRTMCGPTTSSRIAPLTGGGIACSTSSTSSRASAWRSRWRANLTR